MKSLIPIKGQAMRFITSTLLLCSILSFFISCTNNQGATNGGETQIIKGHWGHANDQILNMPPNEGDWTNLYLIKALSDTTYNICLSQEFVDQYPGVQREITQALNIWGYFINRKLHTSFTIANFTQNIKGTMTGLMHIFYNACGNNPDIVIAEISFKGRGADISGNSIASTIYSANFSTDRYGSPAQIRQFQRGMFFSSSIQWYTLSQKFNRSFSSQDIQDFLLSQREIHNTYANSHSLLGTLMHEFGHVWGMCDQYNAANCDINHASVDDRKRIILHDESIMAKATITESLYLAEDDIYGIRQLAKRFPQEYDSF